MNKVIVNPTDHKSETFKIGDLILIHNTNFVEATPAMLVQIDSGIVAAVSLTGGNRWTTGVAVHEVNDISSENVLEMTNRKPFERINSVTIIMGGTK